MVSKVYADANQGAAVAAMGGVIGAGYVLAFLVTLVFIIFAVEYARKTRSKHPMILLSILFALLWFLAIPLLWIGFAALGSVFLNF